MSQRAENVLRFLHLCVLLFEIEANTYYFDASPRLKPDETGFMFDCCSVRLAKVLGEFDYLRLPNLIEVKRTVRVRLGSTTECSIGYAGPRY